MTYQFEKLEHYFEAYEREFLGIEVNRLIEIGVQRGGSLHHWATKYPNARITGIDIDPACVNAADDRIEVMTLDQTDPMLRGFTPESIDVVIDDGGHWGFMQRASLRALWPALKVGGVYVIEDLHVSNAWFGFVQDICGMTRRLHGGPSDVAKISQYQAIAFIHKGVPFENKIVSYGDTDCRKGKGIDGSTAIAMAKNRIRRMVNA